MQSSEFLYCRFDRLPVFSARFLSSCRRVLMTHIGFVAVPVIMPAFAAAHMCTQAASRPWFRLSRIIRLPLPYAQKLIARAGATPVRVGPRPLKSARHPSVRGIAYKSWKVSRTWSKAPWCNDSAECAGTVCAFRICDW